MTIGRTRGADGVWRAKGWPNVTPSPDRSGLGAYGTYKPSIATTGCLPGVPRTDFNSPSTSGGWTLTDAMLASYPISGGYRIVQDRNFYGDMTIQCHDTRFVNCRGYGGIGHPPFQTACFKLDGNGDHSNVEFVDCDASPRSQSYYRNGWVGNNYRCYRCFVSNATDGWGAYSHPSGAGDCNVELWGWHSKDMVFWSQDPAHPDGLGTHNDGVQFQGGSHFRSIGGYCIGSSVDATDNGGTVTPNPKGTYANGQCIMINQQTHIASDVLIDKMWFSKGNAQLGLSCDGFSALTITLGDNRYARDVRDQYPPNPDLRNIAVYAGTSYNITGLYDKQRFDDDNNSLLTAGRATGIRIL